MLLVLVSMHFSMAYYGEMQSYPRANGRQQMQHLNPAAMYSSKGADGPMRSFPEKNTFIKENFVNNYNKGRNLNQPNDLEKPTRKQYGPRGAISAAVQSKFSVEYVNVDMVPQEPLEPQVIEIEGSVLPLILHFKSVSSPIRIHQMHHPAQAVEVQETKSEDEPHILRHQVTKPIIQEVREIITPYRRIVQEIQPVQEQIQTIVARATGDSDQSELRTKQMPSRAMKASYSTPQAHSVLPSNSGQRTSSSSSNIRILH